jgi:hypothetical protein
LYEKTARRKGLSGNRWIKFVGSDDVFLVAEGEDGDGGDLGADGEEGVAGVLVGEVGEEEEAGGLRGEF